MRNPDCCICVERKGKIKHQGGWLPVARGERLVVPPGGCEAFDSVLGVDDEDEL